MTIVIDPTFRLEHLTDDIKKQGWINKGLPPDPMSIENANIILWASRWCLFIDPQGQVKQWCVLVCTLGGMWDPRPPPPPQSLASQATPPPPPQPSAFPPSLWGMAFQAGSHRQNAVLQADPTSGARCPKPPPDGLAQQASPRWLRRQ